MERKTGNLISYAQFFLEKLCIFDIIYYFCQETEDTAYNYSDYMLRGRF